MTEPVARRMTQGFAGGADLPVFVDANLAARGNFAFGGQRPFDAAPRDQRRVRFGRFRCFRQRQIPLVRSSIFRANRWSRIQVHLLVLEVELVADIRLDRVDRVFAFFIGFGAAQLSNFAALPGACPRMRDRRAAAGRDLADDRTRQRARGSDAEEEKTGKPDRAEPRFQQCPRRLLEPREAANRARILKASRSTATPPPHYLKFLAIGGTACCECCL